MKFSECLYRTFKAAVTSTAVRLLSLLCFAVFLAWLVSWLVSPNKESKILLKRADKAVRNDDSNVLLTSDPAESNDEFYNYFVKSFVFYTDNANLTLELSFEEMAKSIRQFITYTQLTSTDIISFQSSTCLINIKHQVLSVLQYDGDSSSEEFAESGKQGIRCNSASPPFFISSKILKRHKLTTQDSSSGLLYREIGMSVNLLKVFVVEKDLHVTTLVLSESNSLQEYVYSLRKRWYSMANSLQVVLPSLMKLGLDYGFKVIQEPQGKLAWLECGRTAQSCLQEDPSAPPEPGFPPCCAYLLKWVLFQFHDVIRSVGEEFFISGGTLLGAERAGKIIPWDDDLDIAFENAVNSFPQWGPLLTSTTNETLYSVPRGNVLMKVFFAQPWRTELPLRSCTTVSSSSSISTCSSQKLEEMWRSVEGRVKAMKFDRHRRLVFLDIIAAPGKVTPYARSFWPWKECIPIQLEGREFCSPPDRIKHHYFKEVYGPNYMKPDKQWKT